MGLCVVIGMDEEEWYWDIEGDEWVGEEEDMWWETYCDEHPDDPDCS